MGSLGLPEIAFIFVLALLIFGPKRLPEIGRTIGRGMAEFRKATNELKRTINTELALDEQPVPAGAPAPQARRGGRGAPGGRGGRGARRGTGRAVVVIAIGALDGPGRHRALVRSCTRPRSGRSPLAPGLKVSPAHADRTPDAAPDPSAYGG